MSSGTEGVCVVCGEPCDDRATMCEDDRIEAIYEAGGWGDPFRRDP